MDSSQESLLEHERVVDAFLLEHPNGEFISETLLQQTLDTFVYRFISYYPLLHIPDVANKAATLPPDNLIASDIFTCKVCLQLFEDPVTLFCPEDSHTFCKTCIKDIHRCITCDSNIPNEFLSGISVSLTIQSLLDYLYPRQMQCYDNRKQGNRMVKSKDFRGAIGKYSEAIRQGSSIVQLYTYLFM